MRISSRFWQYSCLMLLGIILTACQQQQHKSLPRPANQPMQGYIQGQYRYIALDLPGVLREIYVQRGSHVAVGQPLFSLEIEGDTLKQAQLQLQQAIQQRHHDQANLALTRLALKHREKLLQQNAISQESVDEAQANCDEAEAQVAKDQTAVEEAKAAVAQAGWAKTQKMVMADVPALVANAYYLPGAWVPARKPIVALLASEDIKIIFFAPQSNLGRLTVGQTVRIACRNCPAGLSGKISAISQEAEYTPPLLYNDQSSRQIVYRIEAAVLSQTAARMRFNQPVTVVLE
jgi:HlyD family secretion protein